MHSTRDARSRNDVCGISCGGTRDCPTTCNSCREASQTAVPC